MITAFTYSNDILLSGIVDGFIYALVALGLVLVYRATGVINFAQGQIGAFGGFAMAILFVNYGVAYWLSFPLAIASGAVLGIASELALRRLFNQPRLLLFVATLGIAQIILLLQLQLPEISTFTEYPRAIKSRWNFDAIGVTLRGEELLVLVLVPAIVLALWFVLQRTAFGASVRAAADNASAASLAGISVKAVSTQVWAIAGTLAAVSALLIGPVQNLDAGSVQQALGPKLLLLALTAAMFGRLQSFPLTLLGGVIVGVIDRFAIVNFAPGVNLLVLFILLIVMTLAIGRRSGTAADDVWSFTPRVRAARAELASHPMARWVSRIGVGSLLALAVILPSLLDKPTDFIRYSEVIIYMIVALSATVLTGWAGQLSLGQFAFTAVGGYMAIYYAQSLPYLAALAIAVAFGAGTAIVIGIPALRIRGLYLAVITLGFALTVQGWFTNLDRVATAGEAKLEDIPMIGPFDMRDKQDYYWFCLITLLVVVFLVTRLRRSGMGRSLIGVRDNETTAAAYTVSPTRAKLVAFAVSGGIAALAGALLPFASAAGKLSAVAFGPAESLRIIAIAVIGGIASVTGAILGTLLIVGLPALFEGTGQVQLFASGVGMLVVLLYFPGGLISIVHGVRDILLAQIAKRTGWKPPAQAQVQITELSARDRHHHEVQPDSDPLETRKVSVRFGGRIAVDAVDITVGHGEIVGLVGTNGAGKTTLMNAIGGFVPADGGVQLFGKHVEGMAAYQRARQGIGRAFQNARLFPSMTVRETVMLALEARERSLLIPSLLMLPPSPAAEKRKRGQADEIILFLGLGRYGDSHLGELSTGTRRVVELGCLIALDTRLMLLDEPTAGVAQRETEAFGPLIRSINKELGSSILIIEHDMPMVMSISDRIYCLEAGGVIAEGTPREVRENPLVIASYLGTDQRAIQRSN